MNLQIFSIEPMHDRLHIKLILLLTAYIFVLGVSCRRILEAQFLQLLLQFQESFLAGMEHENFQEDKEQVDDGIGVAEEIVLR